MEWDKLKFWKKEESFDIPDLPTYPTGVPQTPRSDTMPPQPEPYFSGPKVQPIERVPTQEKDTEIINLKLDAIKNSLESINMRLERLENIISGKSQAEQRRVWYK